jgi:glycosyltransferase involved in cell wall biosynthesis
MKKFSERNIQEGWSVIVPAYQAQKYIESCLDSIQNQTLFQKKDNYEILLGIDGCLDTLNEVKKIKNKYKNLKVINFKENKGTFVTLNSLLNNVNFDKTITVGADDIQINNLLETVEPHLKENDLVLYHCQNFTEDGKNSLSPKEMEGIAAVKWSVWKEIGGYKAWKVGADSDFEMRTKKFKRYIIRKPLYLRRIHSESLTQKRETGYGSEYRKSITKKLAKDFEYIEPEMNENFEII